MLLGGVPGVLPGKVTVIGGGVSGTHAAQMAVGMGADVTILDRSLDAAAPARRHLRQPREHGLFRRSMRSSARSPKRIS